MDIQDLQGKLVAIVGFGQKEGKATAEYLLKHGVTPVLFDVRPWEEWDEDTKEYIRSKNIQVIFGPDYLKELPGFHIAFRNPSVPRLTPELLEFEKKGLIITSQIQWFMEHTPAQVIGVTGTKGKGTTSTLISEILKLQSQISNHKSKIYLTGNIGYEQPFDMLDAVTADDIVVYEMSSFQLQDLSISPDIAVVLMVTQEHLDHHKSVEEYREAKANITKHQKVEDVAVYNADYESSEIIGLEGNGQKLSFSTREEKGNCFVKDGKIMLAIAGEEKEIFEVKNLLLKGNHNWENACAAVLAASASGAELEAIQETLKIFKGLEHRLELVKVVNGVNFYNDSFSTVPETAIAALKAFEEPEVVILGGSSKNSDFTDLGKTIHERQNIKALILIGQEAESIKKAIADAGGTSAQIFEGAESMKDIVDQAVSVVQKGDVVLLSPACASFGMFKNYKDRGNQFKELVNKL